MINTLTIDVEDYFNVAALAPIFPMEKWSQQSLRVEDNVKRLLDIFDEAGVKATHFVLGWIAERCPKMVKEIHNRGHEIASHGYSHQLIYKQSPKVFQNETIRSKAILEDLTGSEVIGYRAASYSIVKSSLWAIDILCQAGFKYDSSIFPIHHDRYGIPGSPTQPYLLETEEGNQLIEVPLSTERFMGQVIPIAGGGYFRLYPYWLSRLLYQKRIRNQKPFVFYLHPWEIDPEQPKFKNVGLLSRFRHYNNLGRCENRLKKLLKEFAFGTMNEYVNSIVFKNENTVKLNQIA
jgi:polysaccharide deacetylase family protein (PEP-CTERM system associated)